MTPRPDVSAERKDLILNTAEDVFAQRGFDEARMDDIAERAGLSKGAIYWYFKKKDDIIAALLGRVFSRSINTMRALAAEDAPVLARFASIGQQISRDYQAMTHLMPIALEFYAIALRQRKVRKHLATMYSEIIAIFTSLIEEGIRQDELNPALDPLQAATALVSMYEGLGLVWSISPRMVNWKTLGPETMIMFINGLMKR